MSGKKLSVSTLVMTGVLLLFPYIVFGHTLWVNVTDHSPAFYEKFGASTKTYIGFGHRYPVDDFLPADNLGEYALIGPDGKKSVITPINNAGFLESVVRFRDPGQYLVSVTTKPGFYTMYMENNAIHHKLGPKTGLTNVILSQYYEQYAKGLITAGATETTDFTKPLGHRLEIVPLVNPLKLKGDGADILSVKILFNGRPARYCKVFATYSGFSTEDDFALATVADGEGIARIRLTHWGPWLIKANMRMPAPDDMKDKCNDLNYTATLTLEIP
jgi:uncharacterized GH25 family protein